MATVVAVILMFGNACAVISTRSSLARTGLQPTEDEYQRAFRRDFRARVELARRGLDPTEDAYRCALQEYDKGLVNLFEDIRRYSEMTYGAPTTTLAWACLVGRVDLVRLTLDRGADPNRIDHGWRPIMYACAKGDAEIVETLMDSGAKINVNSGLMTTHGTRYPTETPLAVACLGGHVKCAELLIKRGAFLGDQYGTLALLRAATGAADPRSKAAMLDMLLERGVEVDGRVEGDWTPLQCAAGSGDLEAVRLLIARGADAKGERGARALEALVRRSTEESEVEIARILIANGADVNCKEEDGSSVIAPFSPYSQDTERLRLHRLLEEHGWHPSWGTNAVVFTGTASGNRFQDAGLSTND